MELSRTAQVILGAITLAFVAWYFRPAMVVVALILFLLLANAIGGGK